MCRILLIGLAFSGTLVACTDNDAKDQPTASDSGSEPDSGSDTGTGSGSEPEGTDTTSVEDEDTNAEVYGLLDVALRSDFVADAARIDDEAYQDEHLSEIATLTPAFTGTVGDMTIPAPEVTDYEILVLRGQTDEGGVFRIVQFAYNGMTLVNPVIELALPTDAYETGNELGVCIGQSVYFTVYDLSPSFQKSCVHAISGDAAMTVDLAESLTSLDGGKLHLSGADIPVYYIAATPHGDLTDAMDAPACAEQP